MSISDQVQLPDQPTAGVTTERGLGGHGLVAPHSYHDCTLQLASDASGGVSTLWIHSDPRWTCLFAYATLQITGAAAGVPFRLDLLANEVGVHGPTLTGVTNFNANWVPRVSWYPPPILGTSDQKTTSNAFPYRMRATIPNNNGEVAFLSIRVYNFEKDVQQRVPLSQLFAPLTRGSST